MSGYLARANTAKSFFSNFKDLSFRSQQKEGLEFANEIGGKYAMANMPTGSGKSLMGMTLGKLNTSMVYLCSTKMLQDQIEHDFPEVKVMKGRSNFECLLYPSLTAESCTHSKMRPCRFLAQCPYRLKKQEVINWPLKVLNYQYYLYENNSAGRFGSSNIVICDEADMLENILVGYISLRISKSMIDRYNLGEPKFKTSTAKEGVNTWIEWVKGARSKLTWQLKTVERGLGSAVDERNSGRIESLSGQKNRLTQNISKMGTMVDMLDDTWIWDRTEKAWEFRPIWLTPEMTEKFFFGFSDKFMLMSATLPAPVIGSKLLGLDIDDVDYIEMDSTFPVENRLIYVKPVYNLTRDTFDSQIPLVKKEIKRIIDKHPKEKGIIHAVSYKLARTIMGIGDKRLVTHDAGDREATIRRFKESNESLVLVSPSITRGVDLPDNLCSFIIWGKAPYLSLGDKVTKARTYSGKFGSLWYKSQAIEALIQGAGRGNRHENDYCKTYIPDAQAKDLIVKNTGLIPKWIKEAIRFV